MVHRTSPELRFTNYLVKYLVGFAKIILNVSKCFAPMVQVYEAWFGRVIAPLLEPWI